MFDHAALTRILESVSELMTAHRDRLVQLDQVNGDGDLGISMDDGFRALAAHLAASEEEDLGQLLRQGARVLNEAAPSSLGTILSFGLMGMGRQLRGQSSVPAAQAAAALRAGIENIMAKAESRPGEKTILDALVPGADALGDGSPEEVEAAARAAAEGSEATRQMRAVHGRAAYSAERSLGVLDGGSVVGRLIFEGIAAARG